MNKISYTFMFIISLLVPMLCNGQGQIITSIAGDGTEGYSGPATAAQLVEPRSISIANNGNIYVADHGAAMVRMIDVGGTISRIIGSGVFSYTGDGGPAIWASVYNWLRVP